MTTAQVLTLPEEDKEYAIYSDASKNELGCVMMQEGKVIAYTLHHSKPYEKDYPTHDSELWFLY